jgi:hypothetical protein
MDKMGGTLVQLWNIIDVTQCKLLKQEVNVNPSGKTGTQIPQLPLGDNSSPWGDNAVCT